MATGFPVKANYATGDVLTAANMNDLSGTVNYLQYMPPRNAVLNSNFSVWQRGTSVSITANTGYTADRWNLQAAAGQTDTVSRQATNDTTNLPNIQYCARVQRNSGQTATGFFAFANSFESVNSIPFAGKTVTFSFYARAGANYSSASNALTAAVFTGTGTDQNINSGYTGSTTLINQTATLTTTWQRFSYSATVSTSATELAIYFGYTPVGTAGAADYYEITGVQLELGSVANTYMPNQPTYQGELAACQRYYVRSTSGSAYGWFPAWAGTTSTTAFNLTYNLPVQMRVAPTSIEYGGALRLNAANDAGISITSLTFASVATPVMGASTGVSATATSNTFYRIQANNDANAYIGWSAEL